MAGKNKLRQFAEVTSFPNVLEAFSFDDGYLHLNEDEKIQMKGLWASEFFGNDHPVCLELACGKGEYTLGLARLYPQCNFVGVDIKGNRIWKGAREALQQQLDNAGFLRSRIEFINEYFNEGEVSDIWIIFPDPFRRKRDDNNRLTSKPFLDRLHILMREGAKLHLKTDSESLFQFSLKSIEVHPHFDLEFFDQDIDRNPRSEELAIKTFYEKKHLAEGKKISYLRASVIK